MSEFRMKTLVLGMVRTNCYIISNGETKEAIVVDPADEAVKIEQYLKANDLVCKGILLTHGHFDHILAAAKIASDTGARIYAHEAEAQLLENPDLNCSNQVGEGIGLRANMLLKDQQELVLAGFTIRVLHTPGHTAGGACYYFTGHGILLSGDTLFRETVGRSDLPTGNGKVLITSVLNKLMILEDQVKVYPGHGEATTIGYERDNNVYLSHDPYC
jgi:glyoxylase-like metal-dependent hydrolase (beta-lactamase superfamily II)